MSNSITQDMNYRQSLMYAEKYTEFVWIQCNPAIAASYAMIFRTAKTLLATF